MIQSESQDTQDNKNMTLMNLFDVQVLKITNLSKKLFDILHVMVADDCHVSLSYS